MNKELAVAISNAWSKHPHLMGHNIITTAGTDQHHDILTDYRFCLTLDIEPWRKDLFKGMADALEASL